MQIDVRKPGIQVLLKKNIGRATINGTIPVSQRFAGQQTVVDLTPYLTEAHEVRVRKSVREPAGSFSVAFADKINSVILDSLYAMMEPMDTIEISIAGKGYVAGGGPLPIMMRGFISRVDRSIGMGADGKPARFVVVSGQDYGKILQIMQIFMMPNAPADAAAMITNFPFFAKFGDFSNLMQAGLFTQAVFDKVVNPYIDTMIAAAVQQLTPAQRQAQVAALKAKAAALDAQAISLTNQSTAAQAAGDAAGSNSLLLQARALNDQAAVTLAQANALLLQTNASSAPIQHISTDIQVSGAQVSPFGVGAFSGGTVYSLIQSYGDIGAWNEFFIEDRVDGPYAVYRPNPFIDPVSGNFLDPSVKPPAIVDISLTDVVSMTMSRSDANVANYFWVDSARFNLNYDMTSKALAFQSAAAQEGAPMFVTDYGNVNPALYGTRKMEEGTNQAGIDELNNGNGTQMGAPRNQSMAGAIAWMNLRRQQLYLQNKDNVILESGSMRLKGNEAIKGGIYLRLTHGNMVSLVYVVSATHAYVPEGNYFTEVEYERGTGYIDRIQQLSGLQSPYYSEMVTKQ